MNKPHIIAGFVPEGEIQTIKLFRKEKEGRCVSTSHTYTIEQILSLTPLLVKKFKKFDIEYLSKEGRATLTIPIYN